ncbi:MAG: hypothetical protein SGJ04_00010 [Bacteroidota bacterium]|nr:hypothetical protein [Bacteroidota bacterium]
MLQAGPDVETIGCSSLSAAVPADGILLGFLFVIFIISFSIIIDTGRTLFKSPNIAKPYRYTTTSSNFF